MKRRKILSINIDVLEKLPTKRHLARLKILQQCEQSFDLSDRDESERIDDSKIIQFKESEEWKGEYKKLKDILSKREHIVRIHV